MRLTQLLFGRSHRSHRQVIDEPPDDVTWRSVRPREAGPAVRAWLANEDQRVRCMHGMLHARAGRDMIVEYENGDRAVIRRDIFEKTYEAISGGRFAKRTDIVLRFFTLDYPVTIKTLEGMQEAAAGDWIMEGVEGELWPLDPVEGMRRYVQVAD